VDRWAIRMYGHGFVVFLTGIHIAREFHVEETVLTVVSFTDKTEAVEVTVGGVDVQGYEVGLPEPDEVLDGWQEHRYMSDEDFGTAGYSFRVIHGYLSLELGEPPLTMPANTGQTLSKSAQFIPIIPFLKTGVGRVEIGSHAQKYLFITSRKTPPVCLVAGYCILVPLAIIV